MDTFNSKMHWENIYAKKNQNEFSWYQPTPSRSIEFFESFNLPKNARIIDIGAGDSFFVDYLLASGYTNIFVLDISEAAINRAKARLGENAEKVNWIVSDILDFKPEVKFDFWHDRATFHFFTQASQINRYLLIADHHVQNDKYLVVGTFSDSGPLKCSGVEIKQYSKKQLENSFSKGFLKIKCIDDQHKTPFHTVQNFTFCSFRKK